MKQVIGRGTATNPPNRFERLHVDPLPLEDPELQEQEVPTRFYVDTSRSALARNDSPDLPFRYSLNPYRGCEHGCIYCYARPSHEYLGFSAGLDFETRIMVKRDAPALLARTFRSRTWIPQMVALSGNTDCYQPVERQLRLTRGCLEVFLKHRNPVSIITKNALVQRDIDILRDLARFNLVHVAISITTLDPGLARVMEPRTSTPAHRLLTIAELARNGVPVGVSVAPLIPGLTDAEMPEIVKAAARNGASTAGYILLRLPGAVEKLFLDWVARALPARAEKIVNRIRDVRRGTLGDPRFGTRMCGEGELARTISTLFALQTRRYGLNGEDRELSVEHFARDGGAEPDFFRNDVE